SRIHAGRLGHPRRSAAYAPADLLAAARCDPSSNCYSPVVILRCPGESLVVGGGLEADDETIVELEHRPLDQRWLGEHVAKSRSLVERTFVRVRQLAKGPAGSVDHALPAEPAAPACELVGLDAGRLVVMEAVVDAARIEPCASLPHRVAVLD